MDEKCNQFQKYLHSSGTLKALKEALTSLFRLESWPANPLEFICQKLSSNQNELAELREEVQYLQNIVPDEELRGDIHDEIGKMSGEVSEHSDEHELDILIPPGNDVNQDSKGSDQEETQMVSQSDEISKRENEELNKNSGQNTDKPKQEVKESERTAKVGVKVKSNSHRNRNKLKIKIQNYSIDHQITSKVKKKCKRISFSLIYHSRHLNMHSLRSYFNSFDADEIRLNTEIYISIKKLNRK